MEPGIFYFVNKFRVLFFVSSEPGRCSVAMMQCKNIGQWRVFNQFAAIRSRIEPVDPWLCNIVEARRAFDPRYLAAHQEAEFPG